MAGKIRKLTSLAIAFTVLCLVAASFPQFHVITPAPVMASAVNVVPNLQHASDTSGDTLSGITGDDSTTEDPDTLGSADTGDNVYTVDKGRIMHLDTFDVSSIPDGSTITAAVLHLQYGAEDGYQGTLPVNYDNGGGLTTTGITPEDIAGWSADLTFDLYAAGVDTKSEIENIDIEFTNNDPAKPGAVSFDYVWITVTYAITSERPANQGITISDGATAVPAAYRPIAQGITISDGVTAGVEGGRNISQGITISDGVTAGIERGRDVSQGITISDGVTAVVGNARNVSQGITISDGVTATPVTLKEVAQGITISDGVTAAIERKRNVSQTLSITATTSTEASFSRSVSQGITVSDGLTAVPAAYRPIAQGITVSDGATAIVARGRNINQTLSITATTSTEVSFNRPVSQGISISDGVTATTASAKNVSQGITISDGVTGIPVTYRPLTQGITISDGVTTTAGVGRNISQGITISDGVTATVTTPTPTPPPPGGGGGGAPPPPEPPLPPGTTDVSGFVSADGTFTETVVIESADGECGLTINEGTTGLSGEGGPLTVIAVTEMEDPPAPPENSYIIGLTYDLGPEGATFDPAITVTWSYDPDTLPEGVTEENMVLAYYDEDAGEWVELPSTVDTVNHTITASVSHFTTFAIIARASPPPEPAAFSLSNLSIQPAEVQSQEAVTITVLVANTGGIEGSYTAVLKIKGVKEAEKKVTVAAGDSRSVSFTVSREDAGSYSMVVGELSGSFTIVALPAPPVAPALNWPLLGGAAAAVWGLLIYLGRRRISPLVYTTLPKLRALVALLVSVRLKIAPFTRRIISSFAYTAWPKLRALVALLVSVRLKIAPFTRRIISSLAHTAWPKLRALVTLLVSVRLKTAPFIRRKISPLASTAWPKLRAFIALLAAVRLKIAPFIRRIISCLISRVKH